MGSGYFGQDFYLVVGNSGEYSYHPVFDYYTFTQATPVTKAIYAVDEQGNRLDTLAYWNTVNPEPVVYIHKYIKVDDLWYGLQNIDSTAVHFTADQNEVEVVYVPSQILAYEDVDYMEISQSAGYTRYDATLSCGTSQSLRPGGWAKGRRLIPAGQYTLNVFYNPKYFFTDTINVSLVNADGNVMGEEYALQMQASTNLAACQIAVPEDAYLVLTNKGSDNNSTCLDYYVLLPAVIDPVNNVIDEHVQQAGDAKTVYSVSGRQLPAMQRGMNIIRMSDGTVRKVVVK